MKTCKRLSGNYSEHYAFATYLLLSVFIFILFAASAVPAYAQGGTTPRRAIISAMEGSVLVQAAGQAVAVPARKNMEIKSGDRVITGNDGTCELKYDDGSVSRIGPNSRVDISALSRTGADGSETTVLNVKRGSIWNNTKQVVKRNSRFEVNTPAAVASVRGTQFYINVESFLDTIVRVYTGLVGLASAPEDQQEDVGDEGDSASPPPPPSGQETAVSAFQQILFTTDAPPAPPAPLDALAVDDFEKDNLVEDFPSAYVEIETEVKTYQLQQNELKVLGELKNLVLITQELELLKQQLERETDPAKISQLQSLQQQLQIEMESRLEMAKNLEKERQQLAQEKEKLAELKEKMDTLTPEQVKEEAKAVRQEEKAKAAEREERLEQITKQEQAVTEIREQVTKQAEEIGVQETLQQAAEKVTVELIRQLAEEVLPEGPQTEEKEQEKEDEKKEDPSPATGGGDDAPPVSYTLTVSASPEGAGTVSGGGSFTSGSNVTVRATANSGYSFVNWTEGQAVVSSEANYSFVMSGNLTLVANFVVKTPATPEVTTWPMASELVYGQTLADSDLSGGEASVPGTFAFANPSKVPDAGSTMQTVVFTPQDTVNYKTVTGNVTVIVNKATATVTLEDLEHTYDGTPKTAKVITDPAGLSVTITYNGSTEAPVTAGEYEVEATIVDANYTGTAKGTLVIGKATPVVNTWPLASGLVYGQTLADSVLSGGEASVSGTFTFASPSMVPPVSTASYAVIFTPVDIFNYTTTIGSAIVTVIEAGAEVILSGLEHTYDGMPKTAKVITDPPGLNVTITYNGSTEAPVNAGSYVVEATIADANYTGTAKGTLVIGKATPVVTTWPLASGLVFGQTLADSDLSGGEATVSGTFTFASPSMIPSAGTALQAVTFLPEDTVNYNEVQGNTEVTVKQAAATVTLEDLEHTYDGTPKTATVITDPPGLSVTITYNGFSEAPVNAGSYTVVATIEDNNYTGTATGTLVINEATPAIIAADLFNYKTDYGEGVPIIRNSTFETPDICFTLNMLPAGSPRDITLSFSRLAFKQEKGTSGKIGMYIGGEYQQVTYEIISKGILDNDTKDAVVKITIPEGVNLVAGDYEISGGFGFACTTADVPQGTFKIEIDGAEPLESPYYMSSISSVWLYTPGEMEYGGPARNCSVPQDGIASFKPGTDIIAETDKTITISIPYVEIDPTIANWSATDEEGQTVSGLTITSINKGDIGPEANAVIILSLSAGSTLIEDTEYLISGTNVILKTADVEGGDLYVQLEGEAPHPESFRMEEKTWPGTFTLEPLEALSGSTQTITLTYTPGEAIDFLDVSIPFEIGVSGTDLIKIGSGAEIKLADESRAEVNEEYGNLFINFESPLSPEDCVVITLLDKTMPKAGYYEFVICACAGVYPEWKFPSIEKAAITVTAGQGNPAPPLSAVLDLTTIPQLLGIDDTMEYSLDGGESWNDVGQGETTATLDYSEISADKGVHVRVKEQDGVPPGEAQVLMVASTDVDTEECFVNPGDEQEWGTGDEKIAGLLAGAKYALRIDDGAWNVYESDSSCEIIGLSINSSSMVEVVKVEPQAIGTLRFLSMIQ